MKGIGAIEYDDNVIFIRWYNKYDIIEIYICKGGTHSLHHHNYAHSSRFFIVHIYQPLSHVAQVDIAETIINVSILCIPYIIIYLSMEG